MTSKQRSYLKGLAMTMDPIFQIGKSSVTPELTAAIAEALEARELIKITVLKNCLDDGRSIAEVLAERTRSEGGFRVIGKKIVLYKPAKDEAKRKIVLPLISQRRGYVKPRSLSTFCEGSELLGQDWNYGRYL